MADDTLTLAQAGPPGLVYDPATKTWNQPGVAPVTPPAQQPATPSIPTVTVTAPKPTEQPQGPPGLVYDPATKSWNQPGVAPVTPPTTPATTPDKTPPAIPPEVQSQSVGAVPRWQGVHDALDSLKQLFWTETSKDPTVPAGGIDYFTHIASFHLDDALSGLEAGMGAIRQGKPFWDAFTNDIQTREKQRELYRQIYPGQAPVVGGAGAVAQVAELGPLFSPEATAGAAVRNATLGGGVAGTEAAIDQPGDAAARAKAAGIAGAEGGLAAMAGPFVGSFIPELGQMIAPSVRSQQVAGKALTEAEQGRGPGFTGPSTTPATTLDPARPQLTRPNLPPGQELTFPHEDAAQAADAAAARARGAVGGGQTVIGQESNRLWNVPNLRNPVTTDPAKQGVNNAVSRMQRDQPGSAYLIGYPPPGAPAGATLSPAGASIQAVIRDLNALPAQAAPNQVNAITSRLRAIARSTNDGRLATIATDLANEVNTGIANSPEALANPAIAADLRAAQAFTAREHAFYDNNSIQSILRGQRPTAGFLSGVSGLDSFLGDIQTSWRNLSNANPWYNPDVIQGLRTDLVNGARDHITAELMNRSTQIVGGHDVLSLDRFANEVGRQAGFLRRSGVFTQPQLDMIDYMGQMARRIQQSPTFNALAGQGPKRAVDLFVFSALKRALVGGAAGLAGETAIAAGSSLFGDTGLGPTLGLFGATAAASAGAARLTNMLDRITKMPQQDAMRWITRGFSDPQIAADLMAANRSWNNFSDATKRWVTLGLGEEGEDLAGAGSTAARQQWERLHPVLH